MSVYACVYVFFSAHMHSIFKIYVLVSMQTGNAS